MFPQSRVKLTLAFALAAKFFFPLLSFGFKGRKGVVEELAFLSTTSLHFVCILR